MGLPGGLPAPDIFLVMDPQLCSMLLLEAYHKIYGLRMGLALLTWCGVPELFLEALRRCAGEFTVTDLARC